MQSGTFSSALFVNPRIYYQKQENDEARNQQDHGERLILPDRMEVFRKLLEIHAPLTYTPCG